MSDQKLTAKQELFVAEYLVDLNATQAAIRAGYSEKTARQIGTENLAKPAIQKAIDAATAKRMGRLEVTQDKVLRDLEQDKLLARGAGQFSAAIRASELQGKHLKMFVDRVEATHAHSHEQSLDELDRD